MLAEVLRDTEGIRDVPRPLIIPRQLPNTQGRWEQIQAMEKQPTPRKGGRAKNQNTCNILGPRAPLRIFGPSAAYN
jgi:hypothetical protein